MSASVIDLEAQRDRAIAKADEVLVGAERSKRNLSAVEHEIVTKCTSQAGDLNAEIVRIKQKRLRTQIPQQIPHVESGHAEEPMTPARFAADYSRAFYSRIATGPSPAINAALGEGTDVAGGFAVPVIVDGQIVPLAPSDLAVRNLARVIPTTSDIKSPGAAALSTAAAKSEASAFTASVPSLNQFTLSAFLAGAEVDVSVELINDAQKFAAFCGDDLALAVQEYEESKFISGSGSGEPQGLQGNIDTGVAAATADGADNLLSIAATFDILGTLKGTYHQNASWLMQRASGVALRKAQVQSGLFEPVFTRENGQDFLHGYPVYYSESMPAIAAAATPVIFGDFRQGYLIGDRGGPAIRVKVLDQAKALYGWVTLLGYRRTDGRVRRSEALKALTLHS
jgi:HK97 family phage major capsid protein